MSKVFLLVMGFAFVTWALGVGLWQLDPLTWGLLAWGIFWNLVDGWPTFKDLPDFQKVMDKLSPSERLVVKWILFQYAFFRTSVEAPYYKLKRAFKFVYLHYRIVRIRSEARTKVNIILKRYAKQLMLEGYSGEKLTELLKHRTKSRLRLDYDNFMAVGAQKHGVDFDTFVNEFRESDPILHSILLGEYL